MREGVCNSVQKTVTFGEVFLGFVCPIVTLGRRAILAFIVLPKRYSGHVQNASISDIMLAL